MDIKSRLYCIYLKQHHRGAQFSFTTNTLLLHQQCDTRAIALYLAEDGGFAENISLFPVSLDCVEFNYFLLCFI